MHIENVMDFMEQAHTATAATTLKELKKTMYTIPQGPFWLLLQACVQPRNQALWSMHQTSQA